MRAALLLTGFVLLLALQVDGGRTSVKVKIRSKKHKRNVRVIVKTPRLNVVKTSVVNCGNANKCSRNGKCTAMTTRNGVKRKACVCKTGYSGKFCSDHICTQNSKICGSGKCTAQSKAPYFQCKCPKGKAGDRCRRIVRFKSVRGKPNVKKCPKDPSLLKPGDRCRHKRNSVLPSINPTRTTTTVPESVCKHGGKLNYTFDAKISIWSAHCDCQPGYTGHYCERDEICEKLDCQNNSTCVRKGLTAKCQCIHGFSGDRCEKDMCAAALCGSNQYCSLEISAFGLPAAMCRCNPGRYGPQCQLSLCDSSNPCKNGGLCFDVGGNVNCFCPPGYSGPFCEDQQCPESCLNGGQCMQTAFGILKCHCPIGFSGTRCETDVCDVRFPCINGGTCVRRSAFAYNCTCPESWSGRYCEKKICTDQDYSCENSGTCTVDASTSLGFTCSCGTKYSGARCQFKN